MNTHEDTLEIARSLIHKDPSLKDWVVSKFPELKESEDERIRKNMREFLLDAPSQDIVNHHLDLEETLAWLEKQGKKIDAIENFNTEFERQISHLIVSIINKEHEYNEGFVKWAANALLNYAKHELEKQGEQKPDFCHHEVDLSGCSEEYCKAYYDGWNNCNQQHAQLEAEQKPAEWSEEDEKMYNVLCSMVHGTYVVQTQETINKLLSWLKSLKERHTWKPNEEQMEMEMDLKKEIDRYCEPIQAWQIQEAPFTCLMNCARHFYVLGMSVMRERISNPDYNQKVIEKIKSEYPMDASNTRKEK